MKVWTYFVAFLALSPAIGTASTIETSPRPILRNAAAQIILQPLVLNTDAPLGSIRPKQRQVDRAAVTKVTLVTARSSQPRPKARPKGILAMSRNGRNAGNGRPPKGSLCGVPGIEGKRISRVPGRITGCGIAEPVRVTAVNGVVLSQPATIDCTTAKALNKWVKNGVRPLVGKKGGGVKSLRVVAHYACRTRNNRKGARISEHGKGRAVDIAAIGLQDGSLLTVLEDWRSSNRKTMRALHKAACGPFGTVLGPNSDRFHQDHFHFDTARYRSGPYCR